MSAMKMYQAPRTLEEVMRAAGETGATIFAGGTDLMPRWSKEIVPRPAAVVDIKAIEGLSGIEVTDGEICIGACTLMSGLDESAALRRAAPILAEAASRIACPQIRNRATLGGNLCNASPAADTAVPLIALDAVVDVAAPGRAGATSREVSITDFFQGPGKTALEPGEVLTRVRFKRPAAVATWAWEKFGTRPAMEIAVASVGVIVEASDGVIERARVAYGSVAPTPLRGHGAEAALVGRRLTDETIGGCVAAARGEISPISDVRASAGYRREMVGVMLRRMLEDARGG